MSRAILKLYDIKSNTDYYIIWSTIINAPVSYGMGLVECIRVFKQDFLEFDLTHFSIMLHRLELTGSSSIFSIEELLKSNRAGENGKQLEFEEILLDYCIASAIYTKNKIDTEISI